MINGTGTLSYRKKGTEIDKIPAIGFVKLKFAHKASAGATGINLSSLTIPPEMATNGFANPTASQLASTQLLFFRNNLRLTSSARQMEDFNTYSVASSTQINFIGFTALEGEIFTGVIDPVGMTGLKVVDATGQPATGTLAANATDFNIGTPYSTNKYSTTQIGAVEVYLDGVLQVRNSNNSSVTLDGNYYEVDNGGGSFTVIRFNFADPDNTRNVIVVPNGLLSERPDGSMMAVIESVQGQVNNMATYVAALASQTTTTILGGSPTNVDLKAFGDRVLALEQNRARIDLSNTWTAYQAIPGRADGGIVAAGNVGEEIIGSVSSNSVALTSNVNVTVTSILLTPGIWDLSATAGFTPAATTTVTNYHATISKTTNSQGGTSSINYGFPTGTGEVRFSMVMGSNTPGNNYSTVSMTPYRVIISASTSYFLVLAPTFGTSTMNGGGTIRAVRVA